MSTNGKSDKKRYAAYLAGREWGLLKQQVKARSGGICERCKINPSDAVHHLTYERKYHELLEDLQDTCEACHAYTHGLSDEDPLEESRKECLVRYTRYMAEAAQQAPKPLFWLSRLLWWMCCGAGEGFDLKCRVCSKNAGDWLVYPLKGYMPPISLCHECISRPAEPGE